jgi:hypothetical protein
MSAAFVGDSVIPVVIGAVSFRLSVTTIIKGDYLGRRRDFLTENVAGADTNQEAR